MTVRRLLASLLSSAVAVLYFLAVDPGGGGGPRVTIAALVGLAWFVIVCPWGDQ